MRQQILFKTYIGRIILIKCFDRLRLGRLDLCMERWRFDGKRQDRYRSLPLLLKNGYRLLNKMWVTDYPK